MEVLRLHNFCIDARLPLNEELDLVASFNLPGSTVKPFRDHRSEWAIAARAARDPLKDYFQTNYASVSWQWSAVM